MLVDNANIVKNMWANQDLRISGHFSFDMLHRMRVNMILVNSSSAGKKGKNVNVDDLNVVRWTQFSLPHNPGCPRALATPPYHTKILKIIPQPSYDHHDGFGWWEITSLMKVIITATMNMDFVWTLEMNMDFGGNLAGLVPKDILDQVFQIC